MYISSVQSLSRVRPFATPWTAAHQASPSITNSQSLLKLMSVESVMPSNHLILCHPFLLPSIFPSIKDFSNESVHCIRWPKYWSFSISPSNDYSGLISFRIFAIFLRSREQVAVYTSLLALVGGSGNCLSAELCSCHGSVEEKRVENHSGVLWWSIVL